MLRFLENLPSKWRAGRLQETVSQVTRLVERVANRKHVLKEQDSLSVVQALVVNKITYGTPYLGLRKRKKINWLTRKTNKLALGLPPTTWTERVIQLGVYNLWEEMAEAHKTSQLERLKLTSAGRATLQRVGYRTKGEPRGKQRIPFDLRNKIRVAPTPRNMHPEHHRERRRARVEALRKRNEGKVESRRYTDAAKYAGKGAYAVCAVDGSGKEVAAATVRTQEIEAAEETANALAVTTSRERLTIIADSQAACRNFQRGRVAVVALQIMTKKREFQEIQIVETPGHEDLARNKAAHAVARDYTLRAFLPIDRALLSPDEGIELIDRARRAAKHGLLD
ncbi:hypothetical protein HPB47_017789 [Ixodes persulcatus]|uniref:Uncharacterized protein n=1 Tax=Ixodes persulcatus TaxID=34615 RepID=A0AC60QPE0_IXOPE|nr:hypothetical protein HPB47_017789 [Ixodes persulcatus]